MKFKAFFPFSFMLVFFAASLSTGSPVLWMISLLLCFSLIAGICSVLWVSGTLRLQAELTEEKVHRGQEVSVRIRISHRGLIPVAPLRLELNAVDGNTAETVYLRDAPGKNQFLVFPFSAAHVGIFRVGVSSCLTEDLLGFFQIRKNIAGATEELLVLPGTFDTDPLPLSPGDPGSDSMSRAAEDLSAPSDIRSYQPGDPLKKIHWKLSLRKSELLVRTYDEPILRDVLILMDCSRPPSWGHPEAGADVRDALLETAASIFSNQAGTDLGLHLPLFGRHPAELENGMGLPLILEHLARADFSEPSPFESVLQLEARRMRNVGCLVVITARLNSNMVDVMIRMRRLGPCIRLYLITYAPEDSQVLPLIGRLQQADIEVSYVQPDRTV